MGPCLVAVKLFDVVPDVRGADFSVVFGPCENLVPRSFDRPGLVDVDVSRLCGQHPFVAAEQPVDDRGVGLGAPDQEIYLGPGGFACAAYEFAGVFRVGVAAVSGGLFEVCFGEAAQDLGMRALHVIAVEMEHVLSGLFCFLFSARDFQTVRVHFSSLPPASAFRASPSNSLRSHPLPVLDPSSPLREGDLGEGQDWKRGHGPRGFGRQPPRNVRNTSPPCGSLQQEQRFSFARTRFPCSTRQVPSEEGI